jgi:hypothetical protein
MTGSYETKGGQSVDFRYTESSEHSDLVATNRASELGGKVCDVCNPDRRLCMPPTEQTDLEEGKE